MKNIVNFIQKGGEMLHKYLVFLIMFLPLLLCSFTFQMGFFEYPSGTREYGMFQDCIALGKFEFGYTHWIFIEIYDLFQKNEFSFAPFKVRSWGGIWDIWIKYDLTQNINVFVKHRSVHNFDTLFYLYDRWHNYIGIEFNW